MLAGWMYGGGRRGSCRIVRRFGWKACRLLPVDLVAFAFEVAPDDGGSSFDVARGVATNDTAEWDHEHHRDPIRALLRDDCGFVVS